MKNDPTFNDVTWFISKLGYSMSSPYNDGFSSWEIKKKLYEIKDLLDVVMESAPTFADEEEWLHERKTQKAFDKLSARY